ncbi:hypothetical protein ACH5RR_014777 [Cinchona calisaya]|uniref:Uncharacterized protein n=1 Tax=Cinchona calisaya TaxID=153742 RepID=A0ABD2ZWI1_9GENT
MKPLELPSAADCEHCGAKRFHLEPANFCCSGGEISVVTPAMPYDLMRLYTSQSEECLEFRKNVRTHNNSLAFTSLGAKYDHNLTKNSKGVYTFCVQGQVYHFLNGLKSSTDEPSGIQLYFYDTEEELSRRLDFSPRFHESTVKLLMNVLGENPYAKFFKALRDIHDLENQTIVISTETVVEELTDEQNNLLTSEFNHTEFKDLAQFLDSTTQTVGISLATRNDSAILIDLPKKKARQLKNWATRNEKKFAPLIKNKEYQKLSPKMFYQQHKEITMIADLMPTMKVNFYLIVNYAFLLIVLLEYLTFEKFYRLPG